MRRLYERSTMGLRKYNPTTPGRRGATVSDFAELTPGAKPEKSLLRPKTKTGGRNNQGKITARHRGGGHKQQYRMIDFRRNKDGVPAKVDSIQYDPNRSARIALLHYADGEKRYIIAPVGLKAGDEVMSGPDAPAEGRQLPAADEDAAGHGDFQHRAAAGPRRRVVPQRRGARDADGPRGRVGADFAAQRAKFAAFRPTAGRRSASAAIRTILASCWARRAASGGWAVGRTFAARR